MAYDFANSIRAECMGARCFKMLPFSVAAADDACPELMKALRA